MNNPPAFPVATKSAEGHQCSEHLWQFAGMTLRDYFATAALQGILANPERYGGNFPNEHVESAYAVAEAMLAERTKNEQH